MIWLQVLRKIIKGINMARFENKLMKRFYDPDTGSDVYETERGGVSFDLSALRFLHTGVDTIRQIFTCNLKLDVLEKIRFHHENCAGEIININDIPWKLTGSGKKSGYQFILKNLEIGAVVLLKSFYTDADERGSHIKIEVTPQLIDELGLEKVSIRIREIAKNFADTLEASCIAVHLCVDMKGLEIPENFEQQLATRSKRSFKVNSISQASFDVAEAAFIHGRGDTYLFGNSSGLQMCLYDKSKEAIKSDKIDFMEEVWSRTPSVADCFEPEYDNGRKSGVADTVHRLEFRIHHSIIKEFENGNFNKTEKLVHIREAADLRPHLQGLWDYCLNNFRLHHSSTYIHPIWQKLLSEIKWHGFHGSFIYARDQKKTPGQPTRRNVAMWVGNQIRLAVRAGLTTQHLVNHFLSSGLESELADYFGVLLYGSDDLYYCLTEFVDRKYKEHRLNGVVW